MKLADLIDIEVQLARDKENPDPARVKDRNEKIGRELQSEGLLDQPDGEILLSWIEKIRSSSGSFLLGRKLVGVFSGFSLALVVLGISLAVGIVAPTASVGYVNALRVWVVTVLLPLLAVLLFALNLGVRKVSGRAALGFILGLLRDVLSWMADKVLRGKLLDYWKQASESIHVTYDEAEPSRYAPVVRWTMATCGQLIGLVFSLSVGIGLFLVSAFSEIGFGWSTTLRFSSRAVQAGVLLISSPWRVGYPSAVPSPEAIEATRFLVFDGVFQNASGHTGFHEMWLWFLFAGIVVYGVLPRLCLLLACSVKLRRTLNSPKLLSKKSRKVIRQLKTASTGWSSEAVGSSVSQRSSRSGNLLPESCIDVILWKTGPIKDEDLRAWVAVEMGETGVEAHQAGVSPDLEDDLALGLLLGQRKGKPPVVLLVPAWEPPTEEFRYFARELRERVGAKRSLLFDVIDHDVDMSPILAEGEQRTYWLSFLRERCSESELQVGMRVGRR